MAKVNLTEEERQMWQRQYADHRDMQDPSVGIFAHYCELCEDENEDLAEWPCAKFLEAFAKLNNESYDSYRERMETTMRWIEERGNNR